MVTLHPPPTLKKTLTIGGVILVILLFALGNVWIYRWSRETARAKLSSNIFEFLRDKAFKKSLEPTPTPTPSPTPTPTPKPIASGKQSFTVSSGKKTGPQFLKGEINPYDPAIGSHQLWTIQLKSVKPVTRASLTITTDKTAKTLPLELKEGSPTDGVWTATWIAGDTYLYTYTARFTASDGTEENTVELTLR